MPTYPEALDHLQALGLELTPAPDGTRRKWDLAHMRTLAHALGDPQRQYRTVLIAGTNGKGSTAATLQSILSAAGYRTGLYTSPHLERTTERIRIGNAEILEADFARLYAQVAATAKTLVAESSLPHPPSFFETLTALAFLYFAEQHVDLAILEVGLGGRLDATNIVDPLLSILTDIALDHQEYLGPTITAITREKCGILRDGGTLVTLPQHPEANQGIGEAAALLNLRALSAAAYIPNIASRRFGDTPCEPLTRNRYDLAFEGELLTVDSPLTGRHQQRNIALAIAAAAELRAHHNFNLPTRAVAEGIRQTVWPGRLEHLPGTPPLILDVAHNPAGAWTLRAFIAELPEDQPRTLIFSCLADKPLEEMARILFPLFDASPTGDPARRRDHLILTQIDSPRATSLTALAAQAQTLDVPAHAAPHPAAALAQARALTPADGVILATGSVYLIGALRSLALT